MSIYIIDGAGEDLISALVVEVVNAIVEDLKSQENLQKAWGDLDDKIALKILERWEATAKTVARRHILSPEDIAMVQALYSRSPATVHKHLARIRSAGSGNAMSVYYIGYGHASIGDCGTTTLFIEGVSMLTAKAIQDWMLYSGQESSTRYMDFSHVKFENPAGTAEGEEIQERWRSFYLNARPRVREHLLAKYPRGEDEEEKKYEKAIDARTFDVLRSFLPAGAHTMLSWTTNLRQLNDKLQWLCRHPDSFAAQTGQAILEAVRVRYPHSFGDKSLKTSREGGRAEAVSQYASQVMADSYFLEEIEGLGKDDVRISTNIPTEYLLRYSSVLASRPRGAEFPHWLAEAGNIQSEFYLDFGSYRDLQRHRSGTVRMPLLTTRHGFHPWYLQEMPESLRSEAEALLEQQTQAIHQLGLDAVSAQSYVAMGFRVPCRVTQPLPGFVYRLEVRTGKTIHPTLRHVSQRESQIFRDLFGDTVPIYTDMDPDNWTVRRGSQTIEER